VLEILSAFEASLLSRWYIRNPGRRFMFLGIYQNSLSWKLKLSAGESWRSRRQGKSEKIADCWRGRDQADWSESDDFGRSPSGSWLRHKMACLSLGIHIVVRKSVLGWKSRCGLFRITGLAQHQNIRKDSACHQERFCPDESRPLFWDSAVWEGLYNYDRCE